MAERAEEFARGLATGGTLFEELGFYYIGPLDGHNLDHLIPVLENVRDASDRGPVLIHVVTQKGKGYAPAEVATDKYHGVAKFDVITGTQQKAKSNAPCYTSVFAQALIREAAADDRIVAINAAMPAGTGLDLFAQAFPERCFDVGIAEQHAVTFAAGLATEGFRPFCAIYSTFLQRAYDQVVHDVAIQKLPVRFAIDRAGLVGADGATHAGSFDVAYLGCLPGFVIMAAADEVELMRMVATAARHDAGPIAFRYPRGEGVGMDLPDEIEPLEIGKGRVVREGSKVAILSFGARLQEALKAADKLAARGISTTVADARFAKPLDHELIARLAAPAPADPDHRGGLRSAASAATCSSTCWMPACSTPASCACAAWSCPTASSSRARPPASIRTRAWTRPPSSPWSRRCWARAGPPRPRPAPERREAAAVTAVFTIGYQESNPEAVIGTLTAAGVALLVDVRAVAASRRPGFSKRQLAAGVADGRDRLPPPARPRHPARRPPRRPHRPPRRDAPDLSRRISPPRRRGRARRARRAGRGGPAVVPALLRAPRRPLPPPHPGRAAGGAARVWRWSTSCRSTLSATRAWPLPRGRRRA